MPLSVNLSSLNDEDLARLAGACLQELEKRHPKKLLPIKVQFPRGYIRDAATIRGDWAFIKCLILKSNIAYIEMLSDILNWYLLRTDLRGVGKKLLIKNRIFLLAQIVESSTKSILKGKCKGGYAKRLDFLAQNYSLSVDTNKALKKLWDVRNKMHLFLNSSRFYDQSIEISDLEDFAEALKSLKECLKRV